MTRLEGYIDWLREINKFDALDRPTTSEAEVWLNNGLDKFVKTRYSGNNAKMEGFEQSQKRIEDLRLLLREVEIPLTQDGKKQFGNLPGDLMIFISDELHAIPSSSVDNPADTKASRCWEVGEDANGNKYWMPKLMEVTDITRDTIRGNLLNVLSPHIFNFGQARPYRLMIGDSVEIYSDGTYMANDYKMTYIKMPDRISLYFPRELPLCELPEHTHAEIVHIAADLYLAATGGQTVQLQNQIEPTIE